MDQELNKIFTFLRINYKILGIDVLDPSWQFSLHTLFSLCMMVLQCGSSMSFLFGHFHIFDLMAECFSTSAVGVEGTLRAVLLIYHRDLLRDIVDAMQNQSKLFRERESLKRLERQMYISIKRLIFAICSAYSFTMVFALIPIFFPDPRKNNLPHAMYLLFMPSDVAPYWHINYAYHVVMHMFYVVYFTALDGILIVSLTTAVFQIKGLKQILQELDTRAEASDLHDELVFILKAHVDIKRFIKQLEQKFQFDVFIYFVIFCLMMAMGLNVLAEDIFHPMSAFLLAITTKLLLLCFCGNLLLIETDSLADHAYSIDWTSMPSSEQKLLIQFIVHAQTPLVLNGVFMPLTMETFITVIKASYSYFTLLH